MPNSSRVNANQHHGVADLLKKKDKKRTEFALQVTQIHSMLQSRSVITGLVHDHDAIQCSNTTVDILPCVIFFSLALTKKLL